MNSLSKWRKDSVPNKVFDIVNCIILTMLFFACLYPLYYILIVSFSSQVTGIYLLPKDPNVEGYKMILTDKNIWIGFGNTIFYTVVGTLASLTVTLPCAYALSRKDLMGRNVVTVLIMITMFISGGLIPTYLNIYNLHLMNTRAVIILSSLTSAYNIIVSRTFFSTSIPNELLEASKIDGCGNWRFFTRIVMPLSKPIVGVMTLYFGVARWNSYFNEMIYLNDKMKFPLSLYLRRLLSSVKDMQELLSEGMVDNLTGTLNNMQRATVMQYCLIVVSIIPMMLIYPSMQKYFEKGIMIGSVKG